MSVHALFPGTFDPVTLGHVDLVRRAAALFERVTVAVAVHPEKRSLFSTEERLELLRSVTSEMTNVEAIAIDGLVVHACAQLGAQLIVRGVRTGTDFDYEVSMARTNRALAPAVDTVLLAPSAELAHVSSTLVRQIAAMDGDLSAFVPAPVAEALRGRCGGSPTP